ncbi:peptide chain release factor 1 [Kytococcus sp. Marseille-QA3725]
MSDALQEALAEHARLEELMAQPEVVADPVRLRRAAREYAALEPVVRAAGRVEQLEGELDAARELAADDPDFAAEAEGLSEDLKAARDELTRTLLPRDPDDDRDVILEVKAGEGGAESALFAGELVRMYLRHAEREGWSASVMESTDSDLGGVKDARVAIRGGSGQEPGRAPWSRLKFEGGVHRVQRVPVTESQGRIHTSAVGVLVLPEVDDPAEVEIAPADLKVDVFRSSGPGGQSVNTTDSAVRITHLPTGVVVTCQNEKSQLQNKEAALRVLASRLRRAAMEEAAAEASEARRAQVRTVDRSERVRTYNFPESRISDHRSGYKAHNLPAVLDGDLRPVVDSLVADHEARLLAGEG